MSDTPRTDAYGTAYGMVVPREFARTLERDLAARDAEVARLRTALEGLLTRFVSVASLEYGRQGDVAEVVAARAAIALHEGTG
jgi:hypothetical protein